MTEIRERRIHPAVMQLGLGIVAVIILLIVVGLILSTIL